MSLGRREAAESALAASTSVATGNGKHGSLPMNAFMGTWLSYANGPAYDGSSSAALRSKATVDGCMPLFFVRNSTFHLCAAVLGLP